MIHCSRRLMGHLLRGDAEEQRWSELPAAVSNFGSAAILVRVPLDGVSMPMSKMLEILSSGPELEVPGALKVIHDNSIFFVAAGTEKGLRQLHDKVARELPGAGPSFQTMDASIASFHLETPKTIIRLHTEEGSPEREDGEREIADRLSKRRIRSLPFE